MADTEEDISIDIKTGEKRPRVSSSYSEVEQPPANMAPPDDTALRELRIIMGEVKQEQKT